MQKKAHTGRTGFTIVELLIVIVVIGILAAITIIAFNGVQKRAIITTLRSDLKGAATQLELNKTSSTTETYPISSANLKTSGGNEFEYSYMTADNSYCLTAISSKQGIPAYMVSSDNKTPREGVCPGHTGPNTPPIATADSCFTFSAGTITDYSDDATCPKDVVIPGTIGGVAVKTIGDYALYNNLLTSVTIPNSVTSFGFAAFYNNQITSVTIPSSVTNMGSIAFGNNLLTSVTIPSSVTNIPGSTFYNNQLTSVTIPSSVTSIETTAFSKNKLSSVIIPSSVINIGVQAFSYNQITSVTIPNSVANIRDLAFYENQLTSVAVPTSTTLVANAFDPAVIVTRY